MAVKTGESQADLEREARPSPGGGGEGPGSVDVRLLPGVCSNAARGGLRRGPRSLYQSGEQGQGRWWRNKKLPGSDGRGDLWIAAQMGSVPLLGVSQSVGLQARASNRRPRRLSVRDRKCSPLARRAAPPLSPGLGLVQVAHAWQRWENLPTICILVPSAPQHNVTATPHLLLPDATSMPAERSSRRRFPAHLTSHVEGISCFLLSIPPERTLKFYSFPSH